MNKIPECYKCAVTKNLDGEIERLNSEIGCLQVERDSYIHGYDLLKKFLTVYIDETFPSENMDVISNSNKITYDDIIEVFQLLDIKNVNVIGE